MAIKCPLNRRIFQCCCFLIVYSMITKILIISVLNTNSVQITHIALPTEYIALVITSCGRFDALEIAISSFEEYNTYRYVQPKYVIDDCDDTRGLQTIASKHPDYTFIQTSTPRTNEYSTAEYRIILSLKEVTFKYILNNPKYEHLNLKYIFYLEDDWRFYAFGFIEDSLAILNSYQNQKHQHSQISYVHLRKVQLFQPYADIYSFCGGWTRHRLRRDVNGVPIMYTSNASGYNHKKVHYYVHAHNGWPERPCWGHFDYAPGLKRVRDLKLYLGNNTQCMDEYCIACMHKADDKVMAFTVYNGYVGHMGHQQHHVKQVFHQQKIAQNFPFHQVFHQQKRRLIHFKPVKPLNYNGNKNVKKINVDEQPITLINEWIGIDNSNCQYVKRLNQSRNELNTVK
eukprot:518886_1